MHVKVHKTFLEGWRLIFLRQYLVSKVTKITELISALTLGKAEKLSLQLPCYSRLVTNIKWPQRTKWQKETKTKHLAKQFYLNLKVSPHSKYRNCYERKLMSKMHLSNPAPYLKLQTEAQSVPHFCHDFCWYKFWRHKWKYSLVPIIGQLM